MNAPAFDTLQVTYRLRVSADAVERRAEELRFEQTVELPRAAVRDPFVEKAILPRVEAVTPDPETGFRVRLAFPAATAASDPAQLLNVLFGNCSLQDDVSLVDLELPPSVLEALGGPRFGISGLRRLVGVEDRPLTCTALKPMGLSPQAVGELCRTFARAGLDVIKDDHGLADHPFCPFETRVRACLEVVDAVARETGHRALYAPNLVGTPETVARELAQAAQLGARAVLVAPMLLGLPVLSALAHSEPRVAVLGHPAFSGAPRIAPEVLLGTLFRAYGADAVIYPHAGGRFADYTEPTCRRLAERLRAPCGTHRPSLPVPAGGMSVERVRELVRFYGADAMLLVGGSLYEAGPALLERSRSFVANVRRVADEVAGGKS